MNSSVIDMSKAKDLVPAIATESTALIAVIDRAARDPGIDIDKMERLLAMQERIWDRAKESAYNTAMAACQADMPIIIPRTMNTQTGSLYAALEEMDRVARPIYTSYGFGLSFGTSDCPTPEYYRQTCKVLHRDGHSVMHVVDLPPDLAGIKGNPNKTPIQAFGSSMTYGQRFQTKLVFNIVIAGMDNDGNGRPITAEQVAKLRGLLKEANVSEADFLQSWKLKGLADIPAFNFDFMADILEKRKKRIDPRGDTTGVDTKLRDKRVTEITDLVNEYGSDENELANQFRQYHAEYLQPFPELFIAVNDKLAQDGVVSKGALKKLMSLGLHGTRER